MTTGMPFKEEKIFGVMERERLLKEIRTKLIFLT